MQSKATAILEYLNELPKDRRAVIEQLRQTIIQKLPPGFTEQMSYGMIGYVVPHSIYPQGYHCSPDLPLPFISIASQKNCFGFYHMGIYADPKLLEWFVTAYPLYSAGRLDMGKSCVRFKKPGDIPFDLIGELVSKVSVEQWIHSYERNFRKR